MKPTQYILSKIAEEAGEVAQMAAKTQQFGLHEVKPGMDISNLERLYHEVDDLIAVVGMIEGKPYHPNRDRVAAKIEKVYHYLDLSIRLGQTEES